MKYFRNRLTLQIILFLSALLMASAPVYSGSSKYYKLPIFKNYSGEDAAYIFMAYKDNMRIGTEYYEFHESGSSTLILDGQRTRPSRFLTLLKVKPRKHRFKIQGKRVIRKNTAFGYDPVNYPKTYYSKLRKISRKMGKREVWMLLMFWDNRQYSYFLVPLGTLDNVKTAPPPKPGMKSKLGDREVSYFILKAFHDYSVEIANRLKKLKL